MARDAGAEDYVFVDHDTNTIKMVINDTVKMTVYTTGSVLSTPTLSAALARVDQLDGVYRVVLADATAANFGIVLPSASLNAGKMITVKKIDAGANIVYLSGAASEKIDGAATFAIKSANGSATVMSDGVDWKVIGIYSASFSALV
jgi:hypothetical protein